MTPAAATSEASRLRTPPASCRRKHPRVSVDLVARMRSVTGIATQGTSLVRVVDLSQGGARLRLPWPLRPGEWITLDLPEATPGTLPCGRVRARVRTDAVAARDGYNLGVAFAHGPAARLSYRFAQGVPALALLALAAALVPALQLKAVNVRYFWYHPIANAYGLLVSGYIISRLALAWLYRPPRDTGHRPTVSVIDFRDLSVREIDPY